jgi:N-acetylglutamate synthase-like GNAT family acetyltransferase
MDVTDLYQALEFAHYAERFRDKIFVIVLSRNTPFQDLVLDFKVLSAYRIKLVLVAPDPNFELERQVALSNAHGTDFNLVQTHEPQSSESGGLKVNLNQIQAALSDGEMPIVVHHGLTPQTARIEAVESLVSDIVLGLQAKKILFVAQQTQALEDVLSRTRVTYEGLQNLINQLSELGLPAYEPRLRFVQTLLERGIPEIAYLVGMPGRICQEVFTHEGAGILFSRIEHTQIRQAELRDVNDITLQLRPQIEAGRILPVEENTIVQNLGNFWVYEIDGQVVSVMRIKEHDDWVEIATGSTLFRDRKFGRATELIMHLLDEVRKRNKKGVFGVGIDPKLGEKLLPLGFREVEHRELPQAWQEQYDFNRQSRAFALKL